MRSRLAGAAAAVAALLLPAAPALARPAPAAPPVVAIVGEAESLNVLHADFRTRDGRDATFPAGMPRPVRVTLPPRGDFAARIAALAAGRLGHLAPDTLYYVAGTRLLIVTTKDPVGRYATDVVSGDRLHATGVVSAAVGRRYGTAPDALAVFVAGSGPAPWEWVARQPWVDVASTSGYGTPQVALDGNNTGASLLCQGAAAVRAITTSGRLVFSSSGNSTDEPEAVVSPNGLPEVYQVGGVDRTGKTWLPGHTDESDPFYVAGTVVRPYETGDLFSFSAAAPDALDGAVHFGGTSGATPRTAGRAAALVAAARQLTGGRRGPGAYAVGRRTARGPLADGRLTGAELADLLRHSAIPAEEPSPGRYFVEGYGALNATSMDHAVNALDGRADLPQRAAEDSAAAAVRQARAAAFADARCLV